MISVRNHWGPWICGVFVLAAYIRLFLEKVPGHYRVFTAAARALWAGAPAYGTDFGIGIGPFFYLPSCGLFWLGPFSLLPEKTGVFAYVTLSVALFVVGVRALFLKHGRGTEHNLLWVSLSPFLFLACLTHKLEVASTGLVLLSVAWLLEGRRLRLSSFVFATVLSWKLQFIPTLLLMALPIFFLKKGRLWFLRVTAWSCFWLLAPYLTHAWRAGGMDYISASYRLLGVTLSAFTAEAYASFDNLFQFLVRGFGLTLTSNDTRVLSLAMGIVFAGAVVYDAVRTRRWDRGLCLALAAGAGFITVFSPLSQNNAYILLTPLLGVALVERFFERNHLYWFGVGICVCVLMFAYTSFLPEAWREAIRYASPKPAAAFVLSVWVMAFFLFGRRREAEN